MNCAIAPLALEIIARARAAEVRTMLCFAEEEIVLPDGPFRGRRFRCDRQPYSRLWFEEVTPAASHGRFRRFVFTGPSQSGKTLCGFVIPIMYHLFELQETVIMAAPTLEICRDKWEKALKPVVARSRYAEFMPSSGRGSRGGVEFENITFGNGSTLKFMSGSGQDKRRAAYTARVVVVTETDGFDQPGEVSREADPISQLEARTRAYGALARIYLECTLSTERGRTWTELKSGSDSRLLFPCVHCREMVMPERAELVGWQDAGSVVEARSKTHFACPACKTPINDEERAAMNAALAIAHDPRETDTLGFRTTAFSNLFIPAADLGADEWRGARERDSENAEKRLKQFVWCLPWEPPSIESDPLDSESLKRRCHALPRGIVPAGTATLTVGVDLGLRVGHYFAVAWDATGGGRVVDYGQFEVPSQSIEAERAILIGLREFRDLCSAGWGMEAGGTRVPDAVWIDSGYQGPMEGVYPVYAFCRESGDRYRPIKGMGYSSAVRRNYIAPKQRSNTVRYIGEGFHFVALRREGIHLVEIDSDLWKTRVQRSLSVPADSPGALTLFQATSAQHTGVVKHLTSERRIEEFHPSRGVVVTWERVHRANHWFDAAYIAAAAASFCGTSSEPAGTDAPGRPQRIEREGALMTPDGRPFLVTERG